MVIVLGTSLVGRRMSKHDTRPSSRRKTETLQAMQAVNGRELAVVVAADAADAAAQAAGDALEKIEAAVKARGCANVVFSSQSGAAFFEALAAKEGIEWGKIVGFQFEEFVGLSADNPASSRFLLNDALVKLVPFSAFHFINAEEAPAAECARLEQLVAAHPIDVAFVGLGDGGQLGLNDPPNLESSAAFVPLQLSEACRGHLVSEGRFASKEAVPKEAVTLSMQQIMKCRQVLSIVAGKSKAIAVKNVTEGNPSARNPAAFLQKHPDAVMYLDHESSSLLKSELSKSSPAKAAAAAPGGVPAKGFMIRTFRPGQGWVEVGDAQAKERSLGTSKMSPMEQRKKTLAAKRLAALKK
jgi:glucosamine-6-phosphate deaminase